MNCTKCGAPLNQFNQCNNCDKVSVEKLSNQERENFQGITIEDESNQNYRHQQYHEESSFRSRHRQGPKIRVFNMGLNTGGNIPTWKKYLFLVGGISLVACILFFALPLIITAIGVGLVVYMIMKLLFR